MKIGMPLHEFKNVIKTIIYNYCLQLNQQKATNAVRMVIETLKNTGLIEERRINNRETLICQEKSKKAMQNSKNNIFCPSNCNNFTEKE